MTKMLSVHPCCTCGQTVIQLPIKKAPPPKDVRWVYPRKQGDLEVWTPTRDEAVIVFRQHGVHVTSNELIQGRMPYTVPPQVASTDFERK